MRYRSSFATLAACAVFIAPIAFAAGSGGGGSGAPPSQSSYDPTVDYQKGADAYASGKYDEAAKAFKKVVSAVPKNPQANYLLGASYMAQGDFSRAVKPLETALRYDDKMIDARRDLGIAQAKLGKAEKADEQLGALKAMQEGCAATCADSAKLTDAIAKLEAAVAAGPQAQNAVEPEVRLASAATLDATYVAAVSLINEHHYEAAIAKLDTALWAAGPHPDVLTYLGFANRKLKRYDAAETYYREALAIAPSHRGALEYYGELKLERGDIAGARAHLAKLESICGFGCHEVDELRRWIAEGRSSVS
ncbi:MULTISPECIES: lipopolysaccharide assembly protein LapB [unclassified Sphingopyxis]|jgi:tetratricopeptide (TPR) repeat protein|uniref:tetratricopeptide repeat protein n=1 Tax=unclassified Sphingopyxis TaxID=2614943 RepID=UPI0006BEBC88|nr:MULTISPECIES: tetratricopeptide repeat protein [unclassified Sphingopyxis]USI77368.1 tetratricopeptide repeat protein [Sphingopyxis sp. USTB-05]GAO80152.1 TPR domain protein, putative component of TonB system [Sphingopyxis sp. C-1]